MFLHDVGVGGDLKISSHTTVNQFVPASVGATLSGSSLYVSQVREFIAPVGGLKGREAELKVLVEFCRGEELYLWMRAEPWAGKSALLAWFTLFPPADVTVISFFITDRLAEQNNHAAFTASVLDQLAVLLPEHGSLIAAATVNRDGLRNELLAVAANQMAAAGRKLVLVVDGLDEDSDRPQIVTLLPARPEANLRVIVASRHGPRLPVPHGHPLTRARHYLLASSPHAADIRARAISELDNLLCGTNENRELLALITAANGLTGSELTELTGMAPFEIDRLLRGVSGRSFRTRSLPTGPNGVVDPVYALAHETLQRTAEERLGSRQVVASLSRLHDWADSYRELGWPAQTPDFLLRRYFPVLDRHHDLSRMKALALDTDRHDRIRAYLGGDTTTLTEIRTVQHRICDQIDPDLLTSARLARLRDRLHDRNNAIPILLMTLRARLGRPDRAEALARSIPDPERQAIALAHVAEVVAQCDPDQAITLARSIPDSRHRAELLARLAEAAVRRGAHSDHAETAARSIVDERLRSKALARLAEVVAPNDPVRAETIARDIREPWWQAKALARVAGALATIDADRAVVIARSLPYPWIVEALVRTAGVIARSDPDRAETLAHSITEPPYRAEILARVAEELAEADLYRAVTLARKIQKPDQRAEALTRVVKISAAAEPCRAESLAHDLPNPWADEAFAYAAGGMAGTDIERSEALARNIPSSRWRSEALTRVAEVVADTDPERAETLSKDISDPWRADALTRVAAVVAKADPVRAAAIARAILSPVHQVEALTRIAEIAARRDPGQAEALAHEIRESATRTEVLARVAAAMATSDPQRASRLADFAEAFIRSTPDPDRQSEVLARLAGIITATDPELVEVIAQNIPDPERRGETLAGLVDGVAKTDPDRAEAIAHDISEPRWRGEALTRLAEAVAETHPDRAEAISRSIGDPARRAGVLARVAGSVARTDPGRAEALWRRLTGQGRHDAAARVAEAVAVTDPDRAIGLASEIPELWLRAEVFARLVGIVAQADPDRAEAIARDIPEPRWRSEAFIRLVEVLAASDLDRAEAVARGISEPRWRAQAFIRLVEAISETDYKRAANLACEIPGPLWQAEVIARISAVAATDPGGAEALIRSTHTPALRDEALAHLAELLTWANPDRADQPTRAEIPSGTVGLGLRRRVDAGSNTPELLARTDPDRAEALARAIPHRIQRTDALIRVAEVIIRFDPDRAESIVLDIPDPEQQAEALTRLAAAIMKTPAALSSSTDLGAENSSVTVDGTARSSEQLRRRRSKRLLALAWSVSRWEIPLSALPAIEHGVLRVLLAEISESSDNAFIHSRFDDM